jgi:hypothetical protein
MPEHTFMSRSIFAKVTPTRLGAWSLGAMLITACSLTVPSEDTLFGGSAGTDEQGGSSGASGATAQGGTAGEGGRTAQAGSSMGGKQQGGMGNGQTSGAPGAAGAAGAGAGAGGEAGDSTGSEAGAGGEPGIVLPPAILLIRYDFDDLSQLTAKDVSGNGNDGTLAGLSLPIAAAGHINGALKLDGAQKQYVQLPNDILEGRQGISIASWINLGQALAWDRLFDFNAGASTWFFFSPTGWNDDTKTFGTRCATRTTSALAPEIMMTETISIGTWHHVAVVFAKPFLRYYLDGVLKAERDGISFGPDGLGKTNQNWIGRSVYPADPYLTGMVDDFRVYTGALTSEQISNLAAQ